MADPYLRVGTDDCLDLSPQPAGCLESLWADRATGASDVDDGYRFVVLGDTVTLEVAGGGP